MVYNGKKQNKTSQIKPRKEMEIINGWNKCVGRKLGR